MLTFAIVDGFPKIITVSNMGTLMFYKKYRTEYDATRRKMKLVEAGFKSIVSKHNIKKDGITPESYGVYYNKR